MISIIIPVCNVNAKLKRLTKECIESINRTGKHEIILIDNASKYKGKYEVSTTIRFKHNMGIAKSWNVGAEASTGDYLIFANNDLLFPENFERMLVENAICFPYSRSKGEKEFIKRLSGFFFGIDKKTFKRVGHFDENFGLAYYEDTDYFMRAQKKDIKFYFDPRVQVDHIGRATSDILLDSDRTINHNYYINKHANQFPEIS